jgi:hypothetical protein
MATIAPKLQTPRVASIQLADIGPINLAVFGYPQHAPRSD